MTTVQSIGVHIARDGYWYARFLVTIPGKRERVRYGKRKFHTRKAAIEYGARLEEKCFTRVDNLDDTGNG